MHNSRTPGQGYEVGYAKPPAEHRFAKGRTGNPHGRPRKKLSLYDELKGVLAEKVALTVAGEPTPMTIQKALILRLREMAVAGDSMASKLVVHLASQAPAQVMTPGEDIRILMYHAKLIFDEVAEERASDGADG